MKNSSTLKNFIKILLKEAEEDNDDKPTQYLPSKQKIIDYFKSDLEDLYNQQVVGKFGDKFSLENISNLSKEKGEVWVLGKKEKLESAHLYLDPEALKEIGYKAKSNQPWIGFTIKDKKFSWDGFDSEKSLEEEIFELTPEEVASLTSVVQTAEEQGASTPKEIAAQVAQDMNFSDPGGFAQALAPVVAATAKTGFEGADLSSLPKGSQQAIKQVAAKSAKGKSTKKSSNSDAKKAIADFTKEVIQAMNIKQNRKNVSVVDKTLKWLKNQDKLKTESIKNNRPKIRNTI